MAITALPIVEIDNLTEKETLSSIPDLMNDLHPILLDTLSLYGMPQTLDEQRAFVNRNITPLQNWLTTNLEPLRAAAEQLPTSSDGRRYERNLVLEIEVNGGFICVFLHRLNTATPKHWHCNEEIAALAFAAALDEGVCEARWEVEEESREIVQLTSESRELAPAGVFTSISEDYGVHQMKNTAAKAKTLFEIYFEPGSLNTLQVPIPVLGSSTGAHFVHIIPCRWLPDANLETTASKENWEKVSADALQEESKVFLVENGETMFVPQEEWKNMAKSSAYSIYQAPDDRGFLLVPNPPR